MLLLGVWTVAQDVRASVHRPSGKLLEERGELEFLEGHGLASLISQGSLTLLLLVLCLPSRVLLGLREYKIDHSCMDSKGIADYGHAFSSNNGFIQPYEGALGDATT